MRMKLSHIRILVADYAQSFTFYAEKLGLAARFSDVESGYGEFDTGPVTLALFSRDHMASALALEPAAPGADLSGRPILIFNVDDVDVAYQTLSGRGVVFVSPPTDRPAWTIRTAHLKDPDGNLIEINGPIRRRSLV